MKARGIPLGLKEGARGAGKGRGAGFTKRPPQLEESSAFKPYLLEGMSVPPARHAAELEGEGGKALFIRAVCSR